MSKLLRLDFVRDEKKIALAVGDVYEINGELIQCDAKHLVAQNKPHHMDDIRFITSFADRENKGAQPVGRDVPIEVTMDDGDVGYCRFEIEFWFNGCGVVSWKPDYDELLKMQIEHDKKESEMINEKEMKIVDAVCYIGSVAVEMRDAELIATPSKSNTYYKEHEVYRSFYKGLGELNDQWKVVCTIAEFNQCIEEMAAAEWMSDGPFKYSAHVEICKKLNIETSIKALNNKKEKYCCKGCPDCQGINCSITNDAIGNEFGVATPKQPIYTKAMFDAGEKPLVGMLCRVFMDGKTHTSHATEITYISEYGFVMKCPETKIEVFIGDLNRVEFSPIDTRTPEEKAAEELEAAKKKQVDIVAGALSCEHNKKFNDHEPTVPSDFLDEAGSLQDLGLLAEIILPLK